MLAASRRQIAFLQAGGDEKEACVKDKSSEMGENRNESEPRARKIFATNTDRLTGTAYHKSVFQMLTHDLFNPYANPVKVGSILNPIFQMRKRVQPAQT